MRSRLIPIAFALFAALSVGAAERDIFPSDYRKNTCAPENACKTFTGVSYRSAAFKFFGMPLDDDWVAGHRDVLGTMFDTFCERRATCLATPGNTWWFCNDIFLVQLRSTCAQKFPRTSAPADAENCDTFARVFAMGVDQQGRAAWEAAQACAKSAGLTPNGRTFEWWITPAAVPDGYAGDIIVYALDTETHVPVQASVTVEGQIIYSKESPTGKPLTFYAFRWPRKLMRVSNDEGHRNVVAPSISIEAAGYRAVRLAMPTTVPKMRATMTPPKLRKGINHLLVSTTDVETGKPVEARVMLGDRVAGESNAVIEIEITKKGKKPEIWVTSLFNAYSDVVVLPAEK